MRHRQMGPQGEERLVRLTREDDREKRWIVVGRRGAIDFHIHKDHPWSSGVEYHYRTPPEWQRGEEPAREHCWVLGGRCWSDGSSLWASEHWIPLLERAGEDAVWRELERHYREHAWPPVAPDAPRAARSVSWKSNGKATEMDEG